MVKPSLYYSQVTVLVIPYRVATGGRTRVHVTAPTCSSGRMHPGSSTVARSTDNSRQPSTGPGGRGFDDLTFPFCRRFPVQETEHKSDLEKEVLIDNLVHPFTGRIHIYLDTQQTRNKKYFSYGFVVNYSVDLTTRPSCHKFMMAGIPSSSSFYPTPSSSDPLRSKPK